MAAGALKHHVILLPLVLLHHLGESRCLVCEGLPDGRHKLRILCNCRKPNSACFRAEIIRMSTDEVLRLFATNVTPKIEEKKCELKCTFEHKKIIISRVQSQSFSHIGGHPVNLGVPVLKAVLQYCIVSGCNS